jgi:hypothetical protein
VITIQELEVWARHGGDLERVRGFISSQFTALNFDVPCAREAARLASLVERAPSANSADKREMKFCAGTHTAPPNFSNHRNGQSTSKAQAAHFQACFKCVGKRSERLQTTSKSSASGRSASKRLRSRRQVVGAPPNDFEVVGKRSDLL